MDKPESRQPDPTEYVTSQAAGEEVLAERAARDARAWYERYGGFNPTQESIDRDRAVADSADMHFAAREELHRVKGSPEDLEKERERVREDVAAAQKRG